MGAPVGTTGCEGKTSKSKYFVGGAVGATDSRLEFDSDAHYDFQSTAVTAFAGYRLSSAWTLQGAVGALVDGELVGDEMPGAFDIGTGIVASVTAARRWSLGDGTWFVNGSFTFGGVRSPTESRGGGADESMFAVDGRFGATAGKTFAEMVSPYLVARAFGGPVFWTVAGEDVTGTDTSKFQLGAGVNVALEMGLSFVLDVAAVGERSVSAGVSWQL